MNEHLSKIIAGVALGSTLIVGGIQSLPDGHVRFCDANAKCYNLTKLEYRALEEEEVGKYMRGVPMSWAEMQLLIALWRFDLENGSVVLRDVHIKDGKWQNIPDKINDGAVRADLGIK